MKPLSPPAPASFPAPRFRGLAAAVLLVACVFAPAADPAPVRPVVDRYHGVAVTDEYQWLEAAGDPVVTEWTAAQNRVARDYLDRRPERPGIVAELNRLIAGTGASHASLTAAGGRFFALRFQPPAQQPVLVTLTNLDDRASAAVVLDLNVLDPSGGTSIDFFGPSRDGALVAVALSEHGSEAGTLYFYDVATGRRRSDVIPRVQFPTAGGSVAWNADGTGVYYTRYPAPGERPDADQRFHQQVYFHRLGTPVGGDRYELGREFPRIAEIDLKSSPDGSLVLATVGNGDGGEYAHYLREAGGTWRQLTRFTDGVRSVEFGRDPLYLEWPRDNSLYLLSYLGAPRGRVLKMPLSRPELAAAREVVKTGDRVIEAVVPSSSGLYLAELDGGPGAVRFVDFHLPVDDRPATNPPPARAEGTGAPGETDATTTTEGSGDETNAPPRAFEPRRDTRLPLRGILATQGLFCPRGDQLVFATVGFTEPLQWVVYDPNRDRQRVAPTDLRTTSVADFSDVEVLRDNAVSKDGTKVPLTIIRRRGMRLDGGNPVLLTGYGGYGISVRPRFDAARRLWLDQGGVVAVANLRGGGEFGEDWHRAGNLTRKQNVFDDFIACAEWLVRSNYTRPGLLAIEGGSNGGLLVGAALTQRPDLFRAAVAHVGVFDMLRVERDPNGQFNTTEFGSVTDPEQFRALFAYSPYHRLAPGSVYPAVLLLTGEHDGRVNPAHSRKFAARLQAATTSGRPVLLRTSSGSGHGMGTALGERIAQLADVYGFLFAELGWPYSEVSRGPWAGAMTPGSATVKARLARPGLNVRLALGTDPSLAGATYTPATVSATNHHNVVAFPLTGLTPDTRYFYALELDGRLDRSRTGRFRTFPGGPASFQFAYGSCARTASTLDTFDAIRRNDPLFFMNLGDFHYLDITNRDIGRFRAAYDLVLSSPQQRDLYRSTAFAYVWDDHDFGGNNSRKSATSHDAARAAYEEYVPHYPLREGDPGGPICQSFAVGRVKFIVTDLRSARDNPTDEDGPKKSMMGTAQKEWFKRELLEANGRYPLIFWVSSVPWLGERGSNYYRIGPNQYGYIHHTQLTNPPPRGTNGAGRGFGGPGRGGTNAVARGGTNSGFGRGLTNAIAQGTNSAAGGTNRLRGARGGAPRVDDDHWSVFATERREIADFIKANGIRGLAILHGDAHMLAADDGRNADFATGGGAPIPVMCGGPLDQTASIKGGPYSQGVYRFRPGEGGFGLITVTDRGGEIAVRYSGRSNRDEEKVALEFKVPATAPGAGVR